MNTTQLADEWLQLWNGDLQRADELVAQHIQVHATSMDGSDNSFTGADGLLAWITDVRAAFPDLVYTREVGPIAQGELLALRWSVAGTYAGGVPGAAAEVGRQVAFTGTDLLRVADGRLSEYLGQRRPPCHARAAEAVWLTRSTGHPGWACRRMGGAGAGAGPLRPPGHPRRSRSKTERPPSTATAVGGSVAAGPGNGC